ncbi:MAG TPA: hypothetical protein VGJ45_27825 [Pseudonocardiaceae bacterium]
MGTGVRPAERLARRYFAKVKAGSVARSVTCASVSGNAIAATATATSVRLAGLTGARGLGQMAARMARSKPST